MFKGQNLAGSCAREHICSDVIVHEVFGVWARAANHATRLASRARRRRHRRRRLYPDVTWYPCNLVQLRTRESKE